MENMSRKWALILGTATGLGLWTYVAVYGDATITSLPFFLFFCIGVSFYARTGCI